MFQPVKRAKFISSHNFISPDMGDGARMHLWLQENRWPANEFVDLYMKGISGKEDYLIDIEFKNLVVAQYAIVKGQMSEGADSLLKMLDQPIYDRHDKHNLIPMLRELKQKWSEI